MEVKIQHGKEMVVAIKGRLDTVTSAELGDMLKNEPVTEDVLIFDFTDVEYISSAGLRLLVSEKMEMEAQGKALEVHNINDVVREIFSVTGFIRALTVK